MAFIIPTDRCPAKTNETFVDNQSYGVESFIRISECLTKGRKPCIQLALRRNKQLSKISRLNWRVHDTITDQLEQTRRYSKLGEAGKKLESILEMLSEERRSLLLSELSVGIFPG